MIKKIPYSRWDYFISRKIDGEFTCLVYKNGEVFTVNPVSRLRMGTEFHKRAVKHLKKSGIKSALIGGELYVNRPDGKRAWVHDVWRVSQKIKRRLRALVRNF